LRQAHQVAGLGVGLSGRAALVSLAIALGLFGLVGVPLLGQWAHGHPEYHPALRAAVPRLLGALVALKFLLAAWVGCRLLRRGLMTPPAWFWPWGRGRSPRSGCSRPCGGCCRRPG
jgi:hypothetical protein